MKVLDAVLWFLASGFCFGGCGNLPDITDRNFMESCVREHNRARSRVKPPAADMRFMSWDAGLAVIARSWARHCVFEHSTGPSEHPDFPSLGENLWVVTPPSHFSVTFAIQRWVNETEDYTYNSNSCKPNRMCGHYTQVVWARSYKVGCAVHLCPDGIKQTRFSSEPGANFVCNYGPAGNVVGLKPYQTNGVSCSKCEANDTCVDKLCGNKERDSEKHLEASGSEFVSVLILRPVAVLGSVIAAVAVRHFYPDVFCYD